MSRKDMGKIDMSRSNRDRGKLEEYEDIIHLPHHVSRNHPQMSMHDRAAQFAPFSALTGYSEAIAEAARTAEQRQEDKSS